VFGAVIKPFVGGCPFSKGNDSSGNRRKSLRLAEIALVLVRLDHVASRIVNAHNRRVKD
jgi:hypothetical protein